MCRGMELHLTRCMTASVTQYWKITKQYPISLLNLIMCLSKSDRIMRCWCYSIGIYEIYDLMMI